MEAEAVWVDAKGRLVIINPFNMFGTPEGWRRPTQRELYDRITKTERELAKLKAPDPA